ncbi:ABC-type glycerol-3-phosphate transport system permease component [Arthrobacter sp. PL16]|nr:ABC-type glycerol-3-phosphate transport system permease component [Arthrobacter sp. PL16]
MVQEALLEDLLVEYAQTMASAILAALPLLIVFMLFQRQIVKGFATSGLGGQ